MPGTVKVPGMMLKVSRYIFAGWVDIERIRRFETGGGGRLTWAVADKSPAKDSKQIISSLPVKKWFFY